MRGAVLALLVRHAAASETLRRTAYHLSHEVRTQKCDETPQNKAGSRDERANEYCKYELLACVSIIQRQGACQRIAAADSSRRVLIHNSAGYRDTGLCFGLRREPDPVCRDLLV